MGSGTFARMYDGGFSRSSFRTESECYRRFDVFIYNIKDPSRGDIAAFQKDGDERYFVKRIVGLPGETVQIKEGKLLIDGKPLKAEYVSDIGYAGTASEPVHLGKDEYFLLGDNETASDDSREEKIGNIKKKEIYGEVWFVIKPWSDIGFVSD